MSSIENLKTGSIQEAMDQIQEILKRIKGFGGCGYVYVVDIVGGGTFDLRANFHPINMLYLSKLLEKEVEKQVELEMKARSVPFKLS